MSLDETVGEEGNQQRGFLTAAAVDQSTFSYSVKFKPRRNSSVVEDDFESGINVEIFKFLCESLGFTGKALKSRGQMKENENGEVLNEGIVATLNSGMADIAISLYELLPYRMAGPFGVRFLHSVFEASKAVAVFTQPPTAAARNIYGQPFEANVWRTTLGFLGFIALFLIIILLIKFKYIHKVNIGICRMYNYIKLFVVCICSKQGFIHDFNTENPATVLRITLIVCLISSVIFHSIFSSALTSIFTVDVQPISSFQQLVDQRYKIYYDKYVPSIQNLILGLAKNGVTVIEMGHSIKQIMRTTAPQIFASKAVLLTKTDRYYPHFKEKYSDGFLCSKLDTILLPLSPAKSSIFVKQGSPLREKFNVKLLHMQQAGLIERSYKEHNIRTRLNCVHSSESKFVSLDMDDTAFPFLIFGLGAGITIGILFSEIIKKKLTLASKQSRVHN